VTYRRLDSPLHAARAAVGCAYCLAVAIVALVSDHPVVLAAALLAVCLAGVLAGVGRELRRAAIFGIPLALMIAAINPFVVREGLTVIARFGEVPGLGRFDVTLEATVYGGVLGLRALVIVLAAALYSAAVDPDEVLRMFRPVSMRSALTATIATRMVPVLARDGRRLADAQRCRPDGPAPRHLLVRAVATNALDRALDVAATLELRGFGARLPGVAGGRARRPWSRHDVAFMLAAAALIGLATFARLSGATPFDAYPRLETSVGAHEAIVCTALLAVALLPFADRRGIAR
jgi:energy-coupling factor transport system permease protein